MTNIDQFESVFKSAVKKVYETGPVKLESVLVVTDLDESAEEFTSFAQRLLASAGSKTRIELRTLRGRDFTTVGQLLQLVDESACDLIVTYRNLHSTAWQWPHSLGVHVDVLTQTTSRPVLVMPHPRLAHEFSADWPRPDVVMAITDHLTGDDRLVDYASRITKSGGTLYLTHIEDRATFTRYMDIISKTPEFDTDLARQVISHQLLKEPRDYVKSCQKVLSQIRPALNVQEIVQFGHHLSDYRQLIESHRVDLLVLNTKDDDQLAMHGLAYPLSVELRRTSLLLL